MPESSGVRRNPEVDYERSDLSLTAIAILALGILLLLVAAPLVMIGAFPRARGDVDRHLTITPPKPRLQTDPAADLAAYVRKERHLLDSYGWVDRERGIAHVPVEVAMARLAGAGIPGFPRASSPQKPQSSPQPLPEAPAAAVQNGPHSSLLPADTSALGFQQRMGAALPLGVTLRDGTGRLIHLGDLFHGEPVVLVLDYLRCRNLCGVVLEHTAKALSLTPLTAGRDYQVVAISIDPRDGPADAREARTKYLTGRAAPRPDAWHFLTGPEASVRAVADAVGFHYRYDPAIDQFAHPAGIMILTPAGTVARYLLGVGFRPLDLRLGLTEAARGRISSPVADLLLLCYCYDPGTGRYSLAIRNITRALCIATVLGLAFMIFRLSRRRPA